MKKNLFFALSLSAAFLFFNVPSFSQQAPSSSGNPSVNYAPIPLPQIKKAPTTTNPSADNTTNTGGQNSSSTQKQTSVPKNNKQSTKANSKNNIH